MFEKRNQRLPLEERLKMRRNIEAERKFRIPGALHFAPFTKKSDAACCRGNVAEVTAKSG
jgi:hypothetical protein